LLSGLGIASLVIVALYVYTAHTSWRSQQQLGLAVDYLVEGSALYLDTLRKAKVCFVPDLYDARASKCSLLSPNPQWES